MSDLALILKTMEQGDPRAADQLLPPVYSGLRRIAAGKMARESADQTLQPAARVHEAWLRPGGDAQPNRQRCARFFVAAAEVRRGILIDRALRPGGGQEQVDADGLERAAGAENDGHFPAVHDALERVAAQVPPKGTLVKLRHFAGPTIEEEALALGTSEPMAKRWRTYARTWLYREIRAR